MIGLLKQSLILVSRKAVKSPIKINHNKYCFFVFMPFISYSQLFSSSILKYGSELMLFKFLDHSMFN